MNMQVWKYENNYLDANFCQEDFRDFIGDKIKADKIWKSYKEELEAIPDEKKILVKPYKNNSLLLFFTNNVDYTYLNSYINVYIKKHKELYNNEKLKELVSNIDSYSFERPLIKQVENYLYNDIYNKVCCLYGLRQTGKTTVMLQSIKKLLTKTDKVAYLLASTDSKTSEIIDLIDDLIKFNYKYIFIDEITYLKGFLENANIFSDGFAKRGSKIIITGTDSFILDLAETDLLYNRMIKVNTSYISFDEFNKVYPNIDYLNYLHKGGTFDINDFYDETHLKEYIDKTIYENLVHSLKAMNDEHKFMRLQSLLESGHLDTALYNVFKFDNSEFILENIANAFKVGELKKVASKFNNINIENSTRNQIKDSLKEIFNIKDDIRQYLNDDIIRELHDFLYRTNILNHYFAYENDQKKEYYLVQQTGFRYIQLKSLIDIMFSSETFNSLDEELKTEIKNYVEGIVEGKILEHNIVVNILNKVPENFKYNIHQCRLNNRQEWDLVVNYEDHIDIFEVKRNENYYEGQAQWLIDEEMIKYYTDIVFHKPILNRYLIYRGTTKPNTAGNYIINCVKVNDFILNYQNYIHC